MAQSLPAPPDAGLINALRFGTQTFRFIEGIQARFEDGTAVSLPGRPPLVILTNPTLVHEALARPEDFRRVPAQRSAALIAENGLVQSEGDLWRQQRSIMNPAFAGQQVRAYADTTGRAAAALADRWGTGAPMTVNLHRELTAMTIRVATEILLDEDIGEGRAEEFYEWMRIAGEQFEFGLDAVTPRWLPERISPEFRRAADGIRELAEDLIDRRRETLSRDDDPADMLGRLLQAQAGPEIEMPDEQIRDEVTTFLIAGHETTALSLTYTLSLLSWHPEASVRVRAEAVEALGEEPPTYADLENLAFTRQAYLEGLRLYPPAWAVFRQANGDVELGDYRIEAGSAVVMPQWSIHRDPRYFEAPETFDPDRWADREAQANTAYFPFASGPHACIGRQFALSGATLTLARLLRDLEIDVPGNALDDLRVTPTLRPGDDVPATIRPVATVGVPSS